MPVCFLSPSALSFLIAYLHGYNKMICKTENIYSLAFTEKAGQPLVRYQARDWSSFPVWKHLGRPRFAKVFKSSYGVLLLNFFTAVYTCEMWL